MTGLYFKGVNRKNAEKRKNELDNAKAEFTSYSKKGHEDNWNWDELHRLEQVVEHLEYQSWCAEYEDNRRRCWK